MEFDKQKREKDSMQTLAQLRSNRTKREAVLRQSLLERAEREITRTLDMEDYEQERRESFATMQRLVKQIKALCSR